MTRKFEASSIFLPFSKFVGLAVVAVTLVSASQSVLLSAYAEAKKAPFVAADKDPLTETLPAYNANALHRADFRITGKSCAVCLHKIQERMKNTPGSVEAAVMLKKPYGAVVIYDSSKVTAKAILDGATKDEPEVKIVDLKDEAIKKLPLVLIPAYSQVSGEG